MTRQIQKATLGVGDFEIKVEFWGGLNWGFQLIFCCERILFGFPLNKISLKEFLTEKNVSLSFKFFFWTKPNRNEVSIRERKIASEPPGAITAPNFDLMTVLGRVLMSRMGPVQVMECLKGVIAKCSPFSCFFNWNYVKPPRRIRFGFISRELLELALSLSLEELLIQSSFWKYRLEQVQAKITKLIPEIRP